MNLSTHIVFGILIVSLLFGRPEIALMVGVGSAINDLDRESFFLAKIFSTSTNTSCIVSKFLVYWYSVFDKLVRAFLHSFLDSFTTTRDRGVDGCIHFQDWCPKQCMIRTAKNWRLIQNIRSFFLSNDFPGLKQRATKDIKPGDTPGPNRRTYGPALSGKFLDRSIFFGSIALFFLMLLFSVLGLRQFIDLSLSNLTLSLTLPLLIGSIGIFLSVNLTERN